MRRTRIEHMSAGLPPITDIARRGWYGRKVPIAVVSSCGISCTKPRLFDHLVGGNEQFVGHGQPEHLGVLRLITSSNLVGKTTGKLRGFSPLSIRPT